MSLSNSDSVIDKFYASDFGHRVTETLREKDSAALRLYYPL